MPPRHFSRPPWGDSKACRAWLEQRFPLGDASLGSPLYQYMEAVYESENHSSGVGMDFVGMGDLLSWEEFVRWVNRHPQMTASFAQNREKLYPGFGEPTHVRRPWTVPPPPPGRITDAGVDSTQPDWTDVKASRMWLEQCYPLGSSALGSPLLRYMRACHATQDSTSSPATYLGSMLTNNEWNRFLSHCPGSDRQRQHGHPDNILYPEYDEENPDAMDVDSDGFRHRKSASQGKTALAPPLRKRSFAEVDDEQPAVFPSKKRRALLATSSGNDSLVFNPPKETPLADSSRKRSIEDLEDAPSTASMPKRKRMTPSSGNNDSPTSSLFDPPERSTPSPLSRLGDTPTEGIATDATSVRTPLGLEPPSYEDPTTIIFRPSGTVRPALTSGPDSEAIDNGRNAEVTKPDNQPTVHLSDHGAAVNVVNGTQEGDDDELTPIKRESQDGHNTHVEEDREDTAVDPEQSRNRMTSHAIQIGSERTEQTAISVIIPVQRPQQSPTSNQQLSRDQVMMNAPINRNKYKGARIPGTKGSKVPQPESQGENGKRKPPTKGRKSRAPKPQRERQAYVERLRSGVGGRKHRKPSK